MRLNRTAICPNCQKEFQQDRKKCKCCSMLCNNQYRHKLPKKISIEDKFWAFVDKSGGPEACWVWGKHKDKDGYGQFSYATVYYKSHRLAYQLAKGQIPDSYCVMHSCDNPPCCNPTHLSVGTNADNMADKMRKGRNIDSVTEASKGTHKLTAQKVRDIRILYQTGQFTYYKLAVMFGCSCSAIEEVLRRRSWKHI